MPLWCLALRFWMCADLSEPSTRSTWRWSIEMEHLAHHQINIQGTDDVPTKFGIEILNVRRLHKTIYEIHTPMEHRNGASGAQSDQHSRHRRCPYKVWHWDFECAQTSQNHLRDPHADGASKWSIWRTIRSTFKAPTMSLQSLALRFWMCADFTDPSTRSTRRWSI